MSISRNKIGVASVIFGLTLGAVGLASAAPSALRELPAVGPKVTICHATNSETNPYEKIEVAQSAVYGRGHANHTGPVWYPGAKDAGVRWGDIVPPIAGVTDGLNWPEGEAAFNNDCTVIEVQPPIANEAKVTICHATNSETNPYNKITVSQSAVDGGHGNHTGPVWYPGAKDAGVRWGDIIPPVAGVTDGVNWPAGESMYNNCESAGAEKVKGKPSKDDDDGKDDDG